MRCMYNAHAESRGGHSSPFDVIQVVVKVHHIMMLPFGMVGKELLWDCLEISTQLA